jgi:hypothetical protein
MITWSFAVAWPLPHDRGGTGEDDAGVENSSTDHETATGQASRNDDRLA